MDNREKNVKQTEVGKEKEVQHKEAGARERRIVRVERHRDSSGIVGGFFLIFLGLLFFLVNAGLLSPTIWQYILPFWPLFLVLTGLHIILGNSELSRMLLGLITLGFLLYILAYGLRETGSPLFEQWQFNSLPGVELLDQLQVRQYNR